MSYRMDAGLMFVFSLSQLSLGGCKICTTHNLLKDYIYKPSVLGLKHGVCSQESPSAKRKTKPFAQVSETDEEKLVC